MSIHYNWVVVDIIKAQEIKLIGLSSLLGTKGEERSHVGPQCSLDANPSLLDNRWQARMREQSIDTDLPGSDYVPGVLGRVVAQLEEHKVYNSLHQGFAAETQCIDHHAHKYKELDGGSEDCQLRTVIMGECLNTLAK